MRSRGGRHADVNACIQTCKEQGSKMANQDTSLTPRNNAGISRLTWHCNSAHHDRKKMRQNAWVQHLAEEGTRPRFRRARQPDGSEGYRRPVRAERVG